MHLPITVQAVQKCVLLYLASNYTYVFMTSVNFNCLCTA
jgi:hypothetical protein